VTRTELTRRRHIDLGRVHTASCPGPRVLRPLDARRRRRRTGPGPPARATGDPTRRARSSAGRCGAATTGRSRGQPRQDHAPDDEPEGEQAPPAHRVPPEHDAEGDRADRADPGEHRVRGADRDGVHRAREQVHRTCREHEAQHEADYVGWFYDQGTRRRGVHPEIRAAIGSAFSQPDAMRSALGYYRALPRTACQIAEAARRGRLTVPTTAIGADPVGRALEQQLRPITDDLTGHLIPDCGHIVPLDRPRELLTAMALDPARDGSPRR
jgi:hypothetical protein